MYQVSESTQFLLSTPISIAGVKLFQELTVKQFLWGYQDAHFAAMKSAMDCKPRNHEIFLLELCILFLSSYFRVGLSGICGAHS